MIEPEDVYNIVKKYKNARQKFVNSNTLTAIGKEIAINPKNKELTVKWLSEKERRLEKINGFDLTAQIRYSKTLYKELTFLKNLLYWFNFTDFEKITEEDLAKLIEGIEKKTIVTVAGNPLSNFSKKDYYTKVFRGKNTFFGFIHKNLLAQEIIIRKFQEEEEVRFFDFDTLLKIVDNTVLSSHKLAFWLLFDTGIEVNALVQLRKSDFSLEPDPINNDSYFKLNIRKEISKKTRQKRFLPILQLKANELLKTCLENLKDSDKLFNFNPPALNKALKLIVRKLNLKTQGEIADEIRIKDFRSSAACYWGNLGYSVDFINVRLGHKLSSREIDKYESFRAINQEKPRQEIYNLNYKELEKKYNELYGIAQRQEKEIQKIPKLEYTVLGQSILFNVIFEGFTPHELMKIIEKNRKKKGLQTFEQFYKENALKEPYKKILKSLKPYGI